MNKNEKALQEILDLKRKIREKAAKIDDEATLSMLKMHGGKRGRSGRRPIEDKKVQFLISLRQSEIDAAGGAEEAKKIAVEAVRKFILEK